jgi:hypothetical protein
MRPIFFIKCFSWKEIRESLAKDAAIFHGATYTSQYDLKPHNFLPRGPTVKDSAAMSQVEIVDPISRATEILFGLIMVLSFTLSLSAVEAGRSDVREMLVGALGCNIAWGIIDAFFYLMSVAAQRGRERYLVGRLKESPTQEVARELFATIIPETIHDSLSPTAFRELRDHLLKVGSGKWRPLVDWVDVKAACRIFFIVCLTTFPVAIPFLLIHDPLPALRFSNVVALILLFRVGYSLGKYAGRRPWVWGSSMMIVGVVLVSITIALGG